MQDGVETYAVRASDWTRDRKFIITGSDSGKLQLWEAATGRLVWNVKAHAGTVTALAPSPDARTFVTGGAGQNIFMFDLETGKTLWSRLERYLAA